MKIVAGIYIFVVIKQIIRWRLMNKQIGLLTDSRARLANRACLFFTIYYARMPNPNEKAEEPKLILRPTNPSFRKDVKPL